MKKTLIAAALSMMVASPAFAAESADIVVVGSGGAGLSSAITATERGAKVIVLEKMAYFGGNSNRSEGGFDRILIEFRIKILFPDSLPKVDWRYQ